MMMNEIFTDIEDICVMYIDDLMIFTKSYRDAMISIAQGQEGFESLVGDSPNYRVIG